jgi:hypothetical protein
MTIRPGPLRRIIFTMAVCALTLSACSGAAARSAASPSASAPTVSAVPSVDPVGGAASGSTAGNVGSGGPVIGDPLPVDPIAGQPTIVVPKPGQKNPHPVGAMTLRAAVDGRRVQVSVTWYSGVEPCNVLDSVTVERSGGVITVGLVEGSSNLDAVCIEIAMLKATTVDLGDLGPGSWTIRATTGEAPPIQVTIT